MDFAAEAKRHRATAVKYRAIADTMTDMGIRAQYLKLADVYDMLATHEARVAADPKNSK